MLYQPCRLCVITKIERIGLLLKWIVRITVIQKIDETLAKFMRISDIIKTLVRTNF